MDTHDLLTAEDLAARYTAQRLSAHGVTLGQYLADPQRYDTAALEPEPLLPAQRAVAERWEDESSAAIAYDPADGCPHCDDGLIIVCIDDMCRGSGECMHGDGYAPCPYCCDD